MTGITKKRAVALLLFMALIVAADQITKALTVQNIPYGDQAALIPGVVHLTYVRNTGAAFSMFSGMRWLFLALVAAYFVCTWVLIRRGTFRRTVELWCLAAIGGGALGNAVDRALTGKVVDMIELEFMKFAVFNVADCFITCGAAVLIVYILFFNKPKTETPEDAG